MFDRALIVVDVQNDFMPNRGSLPAQDGREVVAPINDLMDEFRQNGDVIVATQDWHPPNHASFASNHEGHEPFDVIDLDGTEQVLWPDHCVQGSEGAEFVEGLNTEDIQAIFRKGIDPEIDSYSGFYDNNHERSTGLASYLDGLGVEKVHVAGVATDYCVKFTVLDSLDEGFETVVIREACRPVDPEDGEAALREMTEAGADVI